MTLDVLPVRTGNAPENMAHDFLLLQRYPRPAAARFRHYDWRGPAWTFGYSQKIAFVRAQLPAYARDLCRRTTGGGVVDHTDDWTYALVVPRGHSLYEARATESYRVVHQALADALREQSIPAELEKRVATAEETDLPPAPIPGSAAAAPAGPAGVCFHRAEIYDVIHTERREKIAGAAQKRNKHGLLLQGSIWKPACVAPVDWDAFHEAFVGRLATALGAAVEHPGWPDFGYDEEQALIDQYATPEWIEHR
ncbi:MAG TPA: lipoate--protein ligase family protein [Opitutaceae bacterium]|nr:lipoate--protein ligase family protein [Opitutaceae bacterium]